MSRIANISLLAVLSAANVVIADETITFEALVMFDPFVISSGGPTGAAFLGLSNQGDSADTLIDARSYVAKKVELHTHIENASGVMQMRRVEGGFVVEAGDEHLLERGGDHIMLMGVSEDLAAMGTISITLVFENAGEVDVAFPYLTQDEAAAKLHTQSTKMDDMADHDHAEPTDAPKSIWVSVPGLTE